MQVKFPNVKVCQYCDKEIHGDAWVSFADKFTATLCSPQCKTLYERAKGQQLLFNWDVVR